jgi:predicted DNA-binding transcriptional regulator AlpA
MHTNREVMPGFLRPKQAARWLGVSVSTLNRLEARNALPRRQRVSVRCVGWSVAVLSQWLAERR